MNQNNEDKSQDDVETNNESNKKAFDDIIAELKNSDIEDPKDKEIQNLKDRILLYAADYENLIKRNKKEVEDAKAYASKDFASSLIDVMDNLYRALETFNTNNTQQDQHVKILVQGVEATLKSLQMAFDRQSIIRIVPNKGDDFDHNAHSILSQIPTSEVDNGKIFAVLQAGYSLKDRLLRPALVSIAKSVE